MHLLTRFLSLVHKIDNEGKNIIFLLFIIISYLYGLFMHYVEGLTAIQSFYFIAATATTVGYGDFSPKSNIGMIITPFYMYIGIGMMGLIMGIIVENVLSIASKKRNGLKGVKGMVDLLIVGYPSEKKVRDIVFQIKMHHKDFKIVILNNIIDRKPEWMSEFSNVYFVKGFGSDVEILTKKLNISEIKKALILSNVDDISSDDYVSSTVSVLEYLNPNIYTIAEKVRDDSILFKSTNCDLVIPITNANIIAQEILNPGAIQLSNALFDNGVLGTQYNIIYTGNDCFWKDIVINSINKNIILEGYSEDGKVFNLLPKMNSKIKKRYTIKYRGETEIENIS